MSGPTRAMRAHPYGPFAWRHLRDVRLHRGMDRYTAERPPLAEVLWVADLEAHERRSLDLWRQFRDTCDALQFWRRGPIERASEVGRLVERLELQVAKLRLCLILRSLAQCRQFEVGP